jgi:hypothetical protein
VLDGAYSFAQNGFARWADYCNIVPGVKTTQMAMHSNGNERAITIPIGSKQGHYVTLCAA